VTASLTRRDFLKKTGTCAVVCASSLSLLGVGPIRGTAHARGLQKGLIEKKLSPYFTVLGNGDVRCDLCPHACEVRPGERGICEVRENIDGKYYSLVYANPCAVHVDPIEKKPFYHVLPTTHSFSLATAGCNFDCKFCQNWEISQARPEDTYNYRLFPEQVIRGARQYQCMSIASTYVEPTIFAEYMIDIARLARENGILKVMHSNGYINEAPLADLCRYLDAACIDLKGFTEEFYREMSEGSLQPVLDTLKRLRTAGVHTEIVNLMIPGKNDDMHQVAAMCRWIRQELGQDVPLHFSRFYPRYKLKGIEPTPTSTLERARETAMKEGLLFVYIGNIPNHPGEHTYCPGCRKLLVRRTGYDVQVSGLQDGRCLYCGQTIPGIWKPPRS